LKEDEEQKALWREWEKKRGKIMQGVTTIGEREG